MGWVYICDPSYIVQNDLHRVFIISIFLVRQLLCKVSYTLCFNSSIELMTWLVIL